MLSGIWGYGVNVPSSRITVEEIHRVWANIPIEAVKARGTVERGVIRPDEDTITMANDACAKAIEMSGIDRKRFGALILGTQTSPYETRPGAAILVDALGLPNETLALDVQFSGKSGTSALLLAIAYVTSGMCEAALAIGADTVSYHVSPGDTQEYTAGSGAAAMVIAKGAGIASIEATASYTSDMPDMFRLDGERYIRSGGSAMTNTAVGAQNHMSRAWNMIKSKGNFSAESFNYVALQQNDARTPFSIGRKLGFSNGQIQPAMIADRLGDCGAASALIGLAKLLDRAKPDERIIVLSYGCGGGSDAIALTTTAHVDQVSRRQRVDDLIAKGRLIDYASYVKNERKYFTHERKVSTFD